MAHALGHLIIHNKAFHVDVRLPNTTAEEAEANTFASGLLVPHGHLEKDLKGRTLDFEDGEVVRELAEKYRVSVQVMATRISGISNP
jgi:Zn-dependent peptidase ImmA (M78 family)